MPPYPNLNLQKIVFLKQMAETLRRKSFYLKQVPTLSGTTVFFSLPST